MTDAKILAMRCPHCGNSFHCKAPSTSGSYFVICTNPDCKTKIRFNYPLHEDEIKLGLQSNGTYRFRCENKQCNCTVLVPVQLVKSGYNKVRCPKCKAVHEFIVEYSRVLVDPPISFQRQPPLKLVLERFLSKKEYILSLGGVHYIGRFDKDNHSDFEIKDKYASFRSICIKVFLNGGKSVYALTVERAEYPVYLNSQELSVGETICLKYGDIIKLGRTLIKVQ